MNTTVTVALAVGALVVLVAAVALRLADRIGLPSLLLYLAFGVGLGESGLGVEFEDVGLTQTLGVAALVVILAEGGLTTRWSDVRRAVGPGVALSTIGVVVSVVVVAAVGVWLLDFSWSFALLVGAVVTSTDAAAVFASLRRLPLPRRMVASLELESGLNDAPVILLVLALSDRLTGEAGHPWYVVLAEVVGELAATEGSTGVVCADDAVADVVGLLQAAGLDVAALTDDGSEPTRVSVVPATLVKGLEFDHVVVVEPAAIVAAEPRGLHRLYVVLTRAVSSLVVLHAGDLPDLLQAQSQA